MAVCSKKKKKKKKNSKNEVKLMITIVLVIYCPLISHPKLSGLKQKQIILLVDSAGEVFASGIMRKAYFCCILSGPRLGSIKGCL